jgi:hypothetical protein
MILILIYILGETGNSIILINFNQSKLKTD